MLFLAGKVTLGEEFAKGLYWGWGEVFQQSVVQDLSEVVEPFELAVVLWLEGEVSLKPPLFGQSNIHFFSYITPHLPICFSEEISFSINKLTSFWMVASALSATVAT